MCVCGGVDVGCIRPRRSTMIDVWESCDGVISCRLQATHALPAFERSTYLNQTHQHALTGILDQD